MATVTEPRLNRAEQDRRVRHPLQTLRGYIRQYVLLESLGTTIVFLALWFWIGMALDWGCFQLFAFDWVQELHAITAGSNADHWLRASILGLIVIALVALVVTRMFFRLAREFSDRSVALLLERRFPRQLGDRLITAVEMADPTLPEKYGVSAPLIQKTIDDAVERVEKLPVADVLDWSRLKRLFLMCGLLTVGMYVLVGVVSCGVGAIRGGSGSPLRFMWQFSDVASIWTERNVLLMDSYWPRQAHLEIVHFQDTAEHPNEMRIGREDDRPELRVRALRWVIADRDVQGGWRALRWNDLDQLVGAEKLASVKIPTDWPLWTVDVDEFDENIPVAVLPDKWHGQSTGAVRTAMEQSDTKVRLEAALATQAVKNLLDWQTWTMDRIELQLQKEEQTQTDLSQKTVALLSREEELSQEIKSLKQQQSDNQTELDKLQTLKKKLLLEKMLDPTNKAKDSKVSGNKDSLAVNQDDIKKDDGKKDETQKKAEDAKSGDIKSGDTKNGKAKSDESEEKKNDVEKKEPTLQERLAKVGAEEVRLQSELKVQADLFAKKTDALAKVQQSRRETLESIEQSLTKQHGSSVEALKKIFVELEELAASPSFSRTLRQLEIPNQVTVYFRGSNIKDDVPYKVLPDNKYSISLDDLNESVRFTVRGKDFYTPRKYITLVPPPTLSRLSVDKAEPAYIYHRLQGDQMPLKGKRQIFDDHRISVTGKDSRISVPLGTNLVLVAEIEKQKRFRGGVLVQAPAKFTETGAMVPRTPRTAKVTDRTVAFDSTGTKVAWANRNWDNTIYLVDIKSTDEDKKDIELEGHRGEVASIAFSADGAWIASGSIDRTVRLWNAKSGELVRTMTGHTDDVTSVAFRPDGKQIASASLDGTVRLWDAETGESTSKLDAHTGPVFSVAYGPQGEMFATSGGDNAIKLWSVEGGAPLRTFAKIQDKVTSLAFDPTGKQLAVAGTDIALIDVESGDMTAKLEGHDGEVLALAYNPDTGTLVSGGTDKTVRAWKSGRQIQSLPRLSDKVVSVAYDPAGKQIVAAAWDKSAQVCSAAGNQTEKLRGGTRFALVLDNVRKSYEFFLEFTDQDNVKGRRHMVIRPTPDEVPEIFDLEIEAVLRKPRIKSKTGDFANSSLPNAYLITPIADVPFKGGVKDDYGLTKVEWVYRPEQVEVELFGDLPTYGRARPKIFMMRGDPQTYRPAMIVAGFQFWPSMSPVYPVGAGYWSSMGRLMKFDLAVPHFQERRTPLQAFEDRVPFATITALSELKEKLLKAPDASRSVLDNLNFKGPDGFDFEKHLPEIKSRDPQVEPQLHYLIDLYLSATDNNVETGPGVNASTTRFKFLVISETELLAQIGLEEEVLSERLDKAYEKLKQAKVSMADQIGKLDDAEPSYQAIAIRIDEIRKALLDSSITTREVLGDFTRIQRELEINRCNLEKVLTVQNRICTPLERLLDADDPEDGEFPKLEVRIQELFQNLDSDGLASRKGNPPGAKTKQQRIADAQKAHDQMNQLMDKMYAVLIQMQQEVTFAKALDVALAIEREQRRQADELRRIYLEQERILFEELLKGNP